MKKLISNARSVSFYPHPIDVFKCDQLQTKSILHSLSIIAFQAHHHLIYNDEQEVTRSLPDEIKQNSFFAKIDEKNIIVFTHTGGNFYTISFPTLR